MLDQRNGSGTATVAVAADFERALAFVLDHERREYEDVKEASRLSAEDAITFRDYAAFRRGHGMPVQDVRTLTDAEAQVTYRAHYWEPMHCDSFSFPVALVLFDSAVNVGTGRVIVWLERILGFEPDGGFGPMTLNVAKAQVAGQGEKAMVEALLSRRTTYYEVIGAPGKPLNKFLDIWLNRIADLKREAGIVAD